MPPSKTKTKAKPVSLIQEYSDKFKSTAPSMNSNLNSLDVEKLQSDISLYGTLSHAFFFFFSFFFVFFFLFSFSLSFARFLPCVFFLFSFFFFFARFLPWSFFFFSLFLFFALEFFFFSLFLFFALEFFFLSLFLFFSRAFCLRVFFLFFFIPSELKVGFHLLDATADSEVLGETLVPQIFPDDGVDDDDNLPLFCKEYVELECFPKFSRLLPYIPRSGIDLVRMYSNRERGATVTDITEALDHCIAPFFSPAALRDLLYAALPACVSHQDYVLLQALLDSIGVRNFCPAEEIQRSFLLDAVRLALLLQRSFTGISSSCRSDLVYSLSNQPNCFLRNLGEVFSACRLRTLIDARKVHWNAISADPDLWNMGINPLSNEQLYYCFNEQLWEKGVMTTQVDEKEALQTAIDVYDAECACCLDADPNLRSKTKPCKKLAHFPLSVCPPYVLSASNAKKTKRVCKSLSSPHTFILCQMASYSNHPTENLYPSPEKMLYSDARVWNPRSFLQHFSTRTLMCGILGAARHGNLHELFILLRATRKILASRMDDPVFISLFYQMMTRDMDAPDKDLCTRDPLVPGSCLYMERTLALARQDCALRMIAAVWAVHGKSHRIDVLELLKLGYAMQPANSSRSYQFYTAALDRLKAQMDKADEWQYPPNVLHPYTNIRMHDLFHETGFQPSQFELFRTSNPNRPPIPSVAKFLAKHKEENKKKIEVVVLDDEVTEDEIEEEKKEEDDDDDVQSSSADSEDESASSSSSEEEEEEEEEEESEEAYRAACDAFQAKKEKDKANQEGKEKKEEIKKPAPPPSPVFPEAALLVEAEKALLQAEKEVDEMLAREKAAEVRAQASKRKSAPAPSLPPKRKPTPAPISEKDRKMIQAAADKEAEKQERALREKAAAARAEEEHNTKVRAQALLMAEDSSTRPPRKRKEVSTSASAPTATKQVKLTEEQKWSKQEKAEVQRINRRLKIVGTRPASSDSESESDSEYDTLTQAWDKQCAAVAQLENPVVKYATEPPQHALPSLPKPEVLTAASVEMDFDLAESEDEMDNLF